MIQVYLLKVQDFRQRMEEIEFAGGAARDEALPGWDKLVSWQREKVQGCVHPGAKALCMGGQLLLQYGAYEELACEKLREKSQGREAIRWRQLTLTQLLEGIPGSMPLSVAYGPQGKPRILQVSWHHNLSHSGDYVVLAISDAPVGIDIQQMKTAGSSIVKRFFSKEEAAAYENLLSANIPGQEMAESRKGIDKAVLFCTLWCRKEAYGKLLGSGLTEDVLKRNMLEDVGVHLYEYGEIPGYCICVCSKD